MPKLKEKQIEQASPQAPVQDILPMPVPVTFKVAQSTDQMGNLLVQLVALTVTGQTVLFLEPSLAKALAGALMKVADMSNTGLLMP